MAPPITTAAVASAAIIGQLTRPSTAMLVTTAAAGGRVVQASEFSRVNAALAAVVTRPATAPGKRSVK